MSVTGGSTSTGSAGQRLKLRSGCKLLLYQCSFIAFSASIEKKRLRLQSFK